MVAKNNRFLLNSVVFICDMSKLNLIKYAKHNENMQQVKSNAKIIHRGTMFIRENNIFRFKLKLLC